RYRSLYSFPTRRSSDLEKGIIRIQAEVVGEKIKVSVSDTGIGISEERLKNLFEPFTTYDEHDGWISGIGLGLTIVKELIDQQQGDRKSTRLNSSHVKSS